MSPHPHQPSRPAVTPVNPALSAATTVHGMAANTTNQKLAFALTGLSVLLVATMAWREMTHAMREQMRDFDRRSCGRATVAGRSVTAATPIRTLAEWADIAAVDSLAQNADPNGTP